MTLFDIFLMTFFGNMADDEDATCRARQHKKELAVIIIIVRVRECFNFKIYYFSYQSLNGICKVQPHEFVFIGIGLIGRLWPSRCVVQQVQNHG